MSTRNQADIKFDPAKNEVVVVGRNGDEVFRRKKTAQTVGIANNIYFTEKYSGRDARDN